MELASKLRELFGNEIVADDSGHACRTQRRQVVRGTSSRKLSSSQDPTDDVSKLLQFASREKIPVTARGGGFGYVGGCVPAAWRDRLVAHADESDQGNQFCAMRLQSLSRACSPQI